MNDYVLIYLDKKLNKEFTHIGSSKTLITFMNNFKKQIKLENKDFGIIKIKKL